MGVKGCTTKKLAIKFTVSETVFGKHGMLHYFSYCINVKINFILITKLLKVIIYSETTGLATIHNVVTIHEMLHLIFVFHL